MKRKTLLSFVLLFFVFMFTFVLAGCNSKDNTNTTDDTNKIVETNITKYTITWLNYDDSVLATNEVDENTLPVYSGSTPTRAASAEYTYIFDGWDKNIVNATADITYKATYRSNKNRYNVKFVDDNGDILISAIEYEYGTPAADIVKPNPTKSATPEYTYTFVGWNPAVTDVVGNQTYTAVYTNAKNKYTVTFKDADGTILKDSKEYEYGTLAADIEKPADPIKESTLEYTYTFTGWTPEVNDVTGNVEYIAAYRQDVRQYGVTFVDNNGQIIKDTTYYPYNTPIQNIIVPADPSTYYENNYKYDFAGWDKEISDVTEDVTYTATYNCIDLSYTQYSITFKDEDGSILKDATLYYYGTPASDIEKPNPTKESTVLHTYEFAGWTPEVEDVYHDAVYTATYNELVRQYSVTFVDDDGTVLSNNGYTYGVSASSIKKPTDPTKEATAAYTYTFAGWTPTITDVDGDKTYTATYTQATRKYGVTYLDDDGTVLKATKYYDYNTSYAYVAMPYPNPTKAETAEATYTFKGWTPELQDVTKDLVYTATYTKTLKQYSVTFKDEDGTILKAATLYDYGTTPSDISKPFVSKPSDALYTYAFDTWSPAIKTVTEDVTYTATYVKEKKNYTVTFVFYEENEVYIRKEWGESFTTPTVPSRSGYRFIGWDTTVPSVIPTYDLVISALWEEIYYSVTVTSSSTYVTYVIEGGASHKEDESVTLKVIAPKGYNISLTKDGTTVYLNSDNEYKFTMPAANVIFRISAKPYTRYGDTVYFGSYPMIKVTYQNTIDNLNNQAGTLPTLANSQKWTSYKYRDGDAASDYMWFIDLENSDGEKYRGVYFTKYRPTMIGDTAGVASSYISSNGYNLNTVYWFKYETIVWQVLEEENGELLMISKYILDSQAFTNTTAESVSTSNGGITSSNTYIYSNVRSFLNTTVYTAPSVQTYNGKSFQYYAINSEQRNIIVKSIYALNDSTTYQDYFGILRTSYTDYYSGKKAAATEYAKIQGLQCVTSGNISYGNYWTGNSYFPSGASNQGKYVTTYDTSGALKYDKTCDNTSIGVRPAVRIKL